MSKVVNLNRARKDRARADRRAQADGNAAKFGRTKAQKAREADDAARAARHIDGHALGPRAGGPDDPDR
ncbi:DUF4169 family protein [Roseivivax isoporae]|uniref:Amidase n=1 Tax=Roseivivax isoporae LMG 25204 TaxID=1449351 RepID=X7F200_9RHOB|nr:DUF4169 family protein [Roseivivax isoporae]ETX26778.1 amidase [Roseivivax isoporae LMG 25204]